MNYIILREEGDDALARLEVSVQQHIIDGWEPIGGVSTYVLNNKITTTQALTKIENKVKLGSPNNQFAISGVNDTVQFGKDNGCITYDSEKGFRIRNSTNTDNSTLEIAEPLLPEHATTKDYVDSKDMNQNTYNIIKIICVGFLFSNLVIVCYCLFLMSKK